MRSRMVTVGLIVALAVAGCDGREPSTPLAGASARPTDPVRRACALDDELLLRLWRGHHPVHSEDITTVPDEPNYSGTFSITSHSGPWDYLQTVPLIFYGPGHIAARGPIPGTAGLVDMFATASNLLGMNLGGRKGRPLVTSPRVPRLMVVIVWDGVGRNVLQRWPDAWPTLARLEREGTSFVDAVVGSSPSITPATHSTLGTGVFPNRHGVTAIEYRTKKESVRKAFTQRDPRDLRLSTFADEVDAAYGNEPLVGMLAWKSWHIGMMGHGTALPGGDHDELAIIGAAGITGNPKFYGSPAWAAGWSTFAERAEELDRADGERDGQWRGHDIDELHDNPAWVDYEADALLRMISHGGYGADAVPDILFVNFKPTDIAGHQYSMDSDEMADVLAAQDRALGRLVAHLDEAVGDYVVVVTADHGHTPKATGTGAWPILQGQLEDDVNAAFDVAEDDSLILQTSAAGPFLDRGLMDEMGIDAAQIARFLNGYTIAQNWNESELPKGYEDRGDEPVFAAAFTSHHYDEVMQCAFGTTKPE